MVFCAYCGKSFTRKEHLERHLPTHTNIRPHRCEDCQLSFSRRDLLQRHFNSYHHEPDSSEEREACAGLSSSYGRTPIACQTCASAKTGCDKKDPCTRCVEKGIECIARFARRSTKSSRAKAKLERQLQQQQQQLQQSSSGSAPGMTPMAGVKQPRQPSQQQKQPQSQTVSSSSSSPTPPTPAPQQHRQQQGLPMAPLPRTTVSPTFINYDVDPTSTSTSIHPPTIAMAAMTGIEPALLENAPLRHSPSSSHASPLQLASPQLSVNELMLNSSLFQPWGEPLNSIAFDLYAQTSPAMDIASMTLPPPDIQDFSSASDNSQSLPSSGATTHTRGSSVGSELNMSPKTNSGKAVHHQNKHAVMAESEALLAAEAAWPMCRCNKPLNTGSCPRTAIVYLERLEELSKQDVPWSSLEKLMTEVDWDASDLVSVVSVSSRTRDEMVAITQSFLSKALEIHRGGLLNHSYRHRRQRINHHNTGSINGGTFGNPAQFNFFVLPSSRILEYFLCSYVRNLSSFYSLVLGSTIDPNEMIRNTRSSILLLLLMIAQGAASVPSPEARAFSTGLIETCRISLFDVIEKDVELSADPTTLRCAIIFTGLGAWSGDKWLMDIAMGQRGMYLSMLKHAGMLHAHEFTTYRDFKDVSELELSWRDWQQCETQNRLVYNWVMLDQELSLFHDTHPVLSMTDLQCHLPAPDELWMAPNAKEWHSKFVSLFKCSPGNDRGRDTVSTKAMLPSLFTLFQLFLHNSLAKPQNLTPQELRLLLHPLQSMLFQVRQTISCFSVLLGSRGDGKQSLLTQLDEIKTLFQRWQDIAMTYHHAHPDCRVTICNLVLYHLICLNADADFPEIERLARRDDFDGTYWQLSLRHKKCILNSDNAVFRAEKVIELLRLLPVDRQPNWWAAALYRATLVLWANSLSHVEPDFLMEPSGVNHADPSSATNVMQPGNQETNHSSSSSPYSWAVAGSSISGSTGSLGMLNGDLMDVIHDDMKVGLDVPLAHNINTSCLSKTAVDVLDFGYELLGQTRNPSRLSDGIRRKLLTMKANWNLHLSLAAEGNAMV